MFTRTVSCLVGASNAELDEHIRDLELRRRAIESELAAAIAVADHRCLYSIDGHRSMAAHLRATCNWSNGEVARFRGAAAVLDAHPTIGDAWAAGHIGSSQVAVLSKVHANRRIADRLGAFVPALLDNAERLPYSGFVTTVDHFVNLADSDGIHDDRTAVEGRSAQAVHVDGVLDVRATGGTRLDTAEFLKIFDGFVDREFQIDLEHRRELETLAGPGVVFPKLRTLAQRRFDALLAMARAANAHHVADATVNLTEPLVSVLVDHQTWSWALAHSGLGVTTSLSGEHVDPFTGLPADNALLDDLLGDPAGLSDRRCVTTNGVPLRPADVLRAALAGRMRRVILGAKRRPIDLGRSERVFTGAARDAAKLLVAWCEHPGCNLPAQLCQVDHSDEWYELGRTNQDNAGVRCSGHNREKHRSRRRVRRSTDGRNHTLRTDGTIIMPVGCRLPDFDDEIDSTAEPERSADPVRCLFKFFDPDPLVQPTEASERMLIESVRHRAELLNVPEHG